jgi:DNA ligase-1
MLGTLYKRTATGTIQVWEIETEIHRGAYRMISGKLGGKMVASEWTVAKPKNTGRANATTAAEQCMLEAKAAWEKKQRDGYSLTADAAHGSEAFQCMLAQTYVDANDPKKSRKPRVLLAASWGDVYSQPKLDGVRLIASPGSMVSRKNREIVAVPHVAEALGELFERHPGLILDGELYNHELKDDFDALVSLVRKTKPTAEDFAAAESMQYWVYDCAGDMAGEEYDKRFAKIVEVITELDSPHVRFVQASAVRTEQGIDELYAEYLEQGFEGQMLRINAPYENKRSDKLIKRKEYEDKEFLVVNIWEGEGNRSGQAGFVEVVEVLGDGTELLFKAGIKAPKERRIELLGKVATYWGGEVTIRFNGRTPKGVPRFPRAIAWYPGGRTV